jgi:hypothetical protein
MDFSVSQLTSTDHLLQGIKRELPNAQVDPKLTTDEFRMYSFKVSSARRCLGGDA